MIPSNDQAMVMNVMGGLNVSEVWGHNICKLDLHGNGMSDMSGW